MPLFKRGTPLGLKRERFNLADDCYIWLRELSSQELLHYQKMMGDKETTNLDFIYDLLSKTALDDDGNAIFTSGNEVKDGLTVGLSTLVAMQEKVMELSGLHPKN